MSSLRAPLGRLKAKLRSPGAWRVWFGLILLAGITSYAFFVIIWRELPQMDLGELFSRVGPGEFGATLVLYAIALALAVGGWRSILGRLSGFWGLADHARIYCLTTVTRRLPGSFWYLLGRVMLYERLGVGRASTALAVGLEFAAIGVSGLIVALITWPLMIGVSALNPFWLIIPLIACVALLNPPVVQAMVRRFSPQGSAHVSYGQLLLWVGIYALIWAIGGLLLFILATAIHPLPLTALPGVIGTWAIVGLVGSYFFSFLPFNMGATELTLATLLSALMPGGEALFVAVLLRAVFTLNELAYALLAGLFSLPTLRDLLRDARRTKNRTPLPDAEKPEEVAERAPVLPQK